VADFSSACGRNLTCVGRFTLQYSNIDLVSFLTMTPTSGPPSVPTLVTILLANVKTANTSFVTASVGDSQKANVLVQVIGASFGGEGLSSQTVITIRISWVGNPRPAVSSVALALTIVLDQQTVAIPTAFAVLPDNQPQFLSLSPSSASIFGGRHVAVFIQPAVTIIVSSFAFSRTNASTQYTVSNPAFSILELSKVGNFTTVFRTRLVTPLSVGTLSLSIRSIYSTVITKTFELEIFPAVTLNNPAISGCSAGDRRVQISVSNLPVSLGSVDVLAVTFNNLPRPAVIVSSATLNFTFPCDEITSSEVSLSISATVFGSAREAATLIDVPTLSLIMSLIVGTSRFPLESSSQLEFRHQPCVPPMQLPVLAAGAELRL
jgi:hypothetical protein